jgi:hypothetical protein
MACEVTADGLGAFDFGQHDENRLQRYATKQNSRAISDPAAVIHFVSA